MNWLCGKSLGQKEWLAHWEMDTVLYTYLGETEVEILRDSMSSRAFTFTRVVKDSGIFP